VPNAAGAALAEKLAGSGAVAAVFLGDGTLGEGVVYESMNLAALWSLPLLFVLEDNGYAQSTPKTLVHAGQLADRPAAFGIATRELLAEDPTAVYTAAAEAAAQVRATSRPFFLALRTYRLAPHSKGDDLRDPAELAAARTRDPLVLLGSRLTAAERAAAEAAAAQRVEAAIAAALAERPQTIAEFAETARWQPL
jgi:TPP-dependent pyruvate/acetoin dehydrogenase alpha subunit